MESFRTSLPAPAEADEQPPSTTQASASASASGFDEAPPPLHMEYYLGMEEGPSAAERKQGEDAKSRVVQEEMVRSVPSSPILDTRANHEHFSGQDAIPNAKAGSNEAEKKGLDDIHAAHEAAEAAKLDGGTKRKKVTIADDIEGSDHKDNDKDNNDNKEKKPKEGEPVKVDDIGTGRGPLHVGGRETKVPYRIDHVLQETRVDQYTNEYLLGMRSHFRYWGNRDIAYHILKTILQQEGSLEGGVLNLKPEMPRPVSAPKNAKEAAEAKAKANAASYHADQQQQQQHRKSFSFSSFRPFSGLDQGDGDGSTLGGNEYSRGAGDGGGGYYRSGSRDSGSRYGGGGWYGDEEELYGYRYSDLDMSSAANVGFSSNTLFQNSPFSKSTSSNTSTGTGGGSDSGKGAGSGYRVPSNYPPGTSSAIQQQQQRGQDRRRSSGMSSTFGVGQGLSHARPQHQQHQHNQQQQKQQEEGSPPSVSEEDIFVPNLTRPPRLHHRSSRLDDKRER
ncbi:MAG: hypothetical protein JOS17DRAFT_746943 [Linnemannia elongata]|nr:MAG: hypothetical protein JOS17DRAFT_746943 [Linnemannia elongata]